MGSPAPSKDNSTAQERSLDDEAVGGSVLIAAAGNEEGHFRSALDRYDDEPDASLDLTLHELTAQEVARACLHGAVRAGTRTDAPTGSSTMPSVRAASHTRRRAHEVTVRPCENGMARIEARLHEAKREGELPGDADPRVLARYLVTLADGIATEAAYGVGADELHRIADVALQAWPSPDPAGQHL